MDPVQMAVAAGSGLARGHVTRSDATGVHVTLEDGGVAVCDALDNGPTGRLRTGDQVLVWNRAGSDRGVVLGRIRTALDDEIPETLVLEARQNLTLRVGGGSITIREDGKILIKGKDLVSHAQRANRIRGGSVSIN